MNRIRSASLVCLLFICLAIVGTRGQDGGGGGTGGGPAGGGSGDGFGLGSLVSAFNQLVTEMFNQITLVMGGLFGGAGSGQDGGTTTPPSSGTTEDGSDGSNRGKSRGSSKINSADCGYNMYDSESEDKVVNGRDAEPHEMPWQVMLIIHSGDKKYLCGGSLVAADWVMTAAHCVSEERHGAINAEKVEVYAGLQNRSDPSSSGAVMAYADCIRVHPEWRGRERNLENDMALLHIPGDGFTVSRSGPINTVCVPEQRYEYVGSVKVSGWGLTRDRNAGGKPSQILQVADVQTISDQECRARGLNIKDSMLCQDGKGKSPCNGDSGGPLAVYDDNRTPATVLGVVSYGPGVCANAAFPHAVYTQVSYFVDYLESQVLHYDGQCSSASTLVVPSQTVQTTGLPPAEYFDTAIPIRLL